ncbi:tetraspanin family protein [Rhizobium ruizarguesonis]|uniref:tetraspanin family protein n=1 Tax=Rhizobium ruizarguesonis TaxID=2081791 RepID=UPI0013E0E5C4|nr:tetraspanin family protein [Rhizobium ruizarguesonis]NEJ94348.1 hypothetical protein [Rhizobium ruizarguesonis]
MHELGKGAAVWWLFWISIILLIFGVFLIAYGFWKREKPTQIKVNLSNGQYEGAIGPLLLIAGLVGLIVLAIFGPDSAKERIATLENQVSGANRAEDKATKEKDEAIRAREEATKGMSIATQERDATNREIDTLKQTLGTAIAEREDAQNQLGTYKERIDVADKNNSNLRDQLQNYTAENQHIVDASVEADRLFRETLALIQRMRMTDAEVAEFERLQADLTTLNNGLATIELQKAADLIIEGRDRSVTFIIVRKDQSEARPPRLALFDFEPKKVVPASPNGQTIPEEFLQLLADNVCRAADRAITANVNFWQALMEFAPALAEAKGNPAVAQLAELAYVKLLVQRRYGAAEVLLIGYADSSDGAWREPLDAAFSHVDVYPLKDKTASEFVFKGQKSSIEVGSGSGTSRQYGNPDLPVLRAAVVSSYLNRVIEPCRATTLNISSVSVLEGNILPRFDSAYRRVVGYLQVPIH